MKIEGSTDGTFDVLLHLGTLIAVFVAYWPDIVDMIREFFLGVKDIARGTTPTPVPPNRRMILLLIIGTLPLFVIVPIKDYIERLSANTIVVGCALLITGVLLFFSDRYNRGKKNAGQRSAARCSGDWRRPGVCNDTWPFPVGHHGVGGMLPGP